MTSHNIQIRKWQRILIFLLSMLIILFCTNTAYATALPSEFTAAFNSEGFAPENDLKFARVGVLETQTMSLLFTQEHDTEFTPTGGAVTMMTAYIALSESDINADIEISEEMLQDVTGGIKGGLRVGDVVKIKDLLASMIMTGAQDCAAALAVYISGSQEAFVQKMNEYATKSNMSSTFFTNVTGAYTPEQKTTVIDLLRLSCLLQATETGTELFTSEKIASGSPNSHLPKEFNNRVLLIDPDRSLYDPRIQAAFGAGSSGEEGFNTMVLAKADDMELMICCSSKLSDRETYKNISLLLDEIEKSFQKADITESVKALLSGVRSDNEVGITAQIEEPIVISALNTWNISDHDLKYELSSITNDPKINELYAKAVISIDGKYVTSIPMLCSSLPDASPGLETVKTPTEEPKPASSVDGGKYTIEDERYTQSTYNQWGWIYWIAVGFLVCSLIALLCIFITKKMK